MRTTLKDIRNYPGINISDLSYNECVDLSGRVCRQAIAYSVGTYGVNGLVFFDTITGTVYKIIGRSTALFMFI